MLRLWSICGVHVSPSGELKIRLNTNDSVLICMTIKTALVPTSFLRAQQNNTHFLQGIAMQRTYGMFLV